jgi:hypothetical protein
MFIAEPAHPVVSLLFFSGAAGVTPTEILQRVGHRPAEKQKGRGSVTVYFLPTDCRFVVTMRSHFGFGDYKHATHSNWMPGTPR